MASQYKTKNRNLLFEYFEEKGYEHFTVSDVSAFFDQKGQHMGVTSIYRQLEKMVDEGIVNKYIIDGTSSACFEYVGNNIHHEHENCFHCKCEKCGKLIHIQCDDLNELKNHLLQHHDFVLNPLRTVFYGLCQECAKR